jgi:hypothetical protein
MKNIPQKIHYAWVIVVCFIGIFAAQGVRFSSGAFMEPWEKSFSAISFMSL